MELLQVQLADFKEKLIEVEKERNILLECKFSMDKVKDDDSEVLFHLGFPNYGALIGFYNFIELKVAVLEMREIIKRESAILNG